MAERRPPNRTLRAFRPDVVDVVTAIVRRTFSFTMTAHRTTPGCRLSVAVIVPALIVAVVALLTTITPLAAAQAPPPGSGGGDDVVVVLDDVSAADDVARDAGVAPPTVADGPSDVASVVVRATPAAQATLRADTRVRAVLARGQTVELAMANSVRHVGARSRWSQGSTGAGQTIAVIDSGVSTDFGGRVNGQACFVAGADGNTPGCGKLRNELEAFSFHCFNAGVCGPGDARDNAAGRPCGDVDVVVSVACQHGSAVAAVAARRSPPYGVARRAGIYAIQVFQGGTADADLVDIYLALRHVVRMHDAGARRFAAVNLSLGTATLLSAPCDRHNDATAAFKNMFTALRRRGIAPVVATGNSGPTDGRGNTSKVAFPACLSNAIPVGASDLDDDVAFYSHRTSGRTVMAPGSVEASTSSTRPLTVPTATGYNRQWEGTSFATPHVAGAMAVLAQEFPRKGVPFRSALIDRGCRQISDGAGTYPLLDLRRVDDVAYIHALHQLFVDRLARSGETRRWCPTVGAGDYQTVTHALATSDEWAGVEIRDLYRKILGREPDSGGYAYWLDRVRNGDQIETLAVLFYGSPEYFGRAGATNRAFVDRLYRDLLGRPADGAGLNYWVGRLNVGAYTRSGVADGFYASTESRRDRVTRLYQLILDRKPEPGGLDYWVGRIPDLGDIALASSLAASSEYYRRVT